MTEWLDVDAWSLRQGVATGAVAAGDVFTAAMRRADDVGAGPERLNLILARHDDIAHRRAARVARTLAEHPEAMLVGVPVAIKDNIVTADLPTTCASRMLDGYVSPYDAEVVSRLRSHGAVIVAKTNLDEFGMGSSTEHSAFGPARNPLAPDRVPGGSSGGSAGCVAAGIVRIALGSDTGGSVRQPAAFCGVVGIKPTYGRVSRFGLVAYASSLDQVGVLGRSVDDAALALGVIAGHDPRDSTAADVPVPDYRAGANVGIQGSVIGVPREYFPPELDSGVRSRCEIAIRHLRELGATIREVSLPHTRFAIPAYYVIAPAEASANLARYDGVRYGASAAASTLDELYVATRSRGFGAEVTRRIVLGTFVLSAGYADAYYRRAQRVRALVAEDFGKVFASGVDLLFTPTAPTTAFRLGAIADPYAMYLSDVFTVTANLAGLPAMSLPIGRADGLPVGGQLVAPHFGEPAMLAAAYALERSLGAEAHR